MNEKFFATMALLWIVFSIYWTYKAAKDKVPAWYGLVLSTSLVAVGGAIGYLLKVIFP